jgi:hypothetical protein
MVKSFTICRVLKTTCKISHEEGSGLSFLANVDSCIRRGWLWH